jgi:hypothetical protein
VFLDSFEFFIKSLSQTTEYCCKLNAKVAKTKVIFLRKMEYDNDVITTTRPESSNSVTLRLYDVFIPLLGLFIISLNLLVVISSGLLLKKRKFFQSFSFSLAPFLLALIKQIIDNGVSLVPLHKQAR